MSKVLLTGNTYPVKDQIKALGGSWDPGKKGWWVPADKAEEAQKLVGTAAPSGTFRRRPFRPCGYPGVLPRLLRRV